MEAIGTAEQRTAAGEARREQSPDSQTVSVKRTALQRKALAAYEAPRDSVAVRAGDRVTDSAPRGSHVVQPHISRMVARAIACGLTYEEPETHVRNPVVTHDTMKGWDL